MYFTCPNETQEKHHGWLTYVGECRLTYVGDCSAVYVYIYIMVKIDFGVGHLQPFVNQAALCFFGASLSVEVNPMAGTGTVELDVPFIGFSLEPCNCPPLGMFLELYLGSVLETS